MDEGIATIKISTLFKYLLKWSFGRALEIRRYLLYPTKKLNTQKEHGFIINSLRTRERGKMILSKHEVRYRSKVIVVGVLSSSCWARGLTPVPTSLANSCCSYRDVFTSAMEEINMFSEYSICSIRPITVDRSHSVYVETIDLHRRLPPFPILCGGGGSMKLLVSALPAKRTMRQILHIN